MPETPASVPGPAPLAVVVPYAWLNHLLVTLFVGLLTLSVLLFVYSFFTSQFPGRRVRILSLKVFGASLATAAANYAVIFFLVLPGLAAQGQNASRGSHTAVGHTAPTFSVQMTDGTSRSSDDLRGKVVVVNFFATWCGPCVLELPHLQRLYDKFRADSRFDMLVIGREETPESVQAFLREHEWNFPAAADPERKAFDRFADNGIPRVYVIDPDGKIAFQSIGFTERGIDRLEESIERLLDATSNSDQPEPTVGAE